MGCNTSYLLTQKQKRQMLEKLLRQNALMLGDITYAAQDELRLKPEDVFTYEELAQWARAAGCLLDGKEYHDANG